MDVTISPHSLKRFTASLTALSKIGKDLYVSFDPFDGLTLSSLNEAKSAYGKFHFECGFFERCLGVVAPPTSSAATHGDNSQSQEESWRYVCRVPVRSVHSVLRPRKGVLSLRIRSEGVDTTTGQHFGVNKRSIDGNNCTRNEDKDGNKLPYSSRRRKRKSRDREQSSDPQSSQEKMMLTFEYIMERPSSSSSAKTSHSAPISATFSALHKIAVTDAHGITLSTSTHRKSRSEIIAPPKLWMRLLDPLKTQEVALTVDDGLKVVTATSFHPGEVGNNAVLGRNNAALKTETSTGVEEFDEYDYRTNRRRGSCTTEDEDDDGMPEDVNERVILVFSMKEAKAMLQFCSQTNSPHHNDGDALSILSFHWGGRPIVIETDGDYFSAELVLATLHHGMISSSLGRARVDGQGN